MLIATLMAVVGSYYTGSVWLGMLFAMASGALVGLLFAFLTVTLRANQVVVGAAINILGSGLSATLFRILFGVSANVPLIDVLRTGAFRFYRTFRSSAKRFFARCHLCTSRF